MALTPAEIAARPAYYINGDLPSVSLSNLVPHALREASIRAFAEPHVRRRQGMFGDKPFILNPRQRASLFMSDVIRKGPLVEYGQRAAGGVRLANIEQTEYGRQHEQALFGDNTRAHGWEHERRLHDLVEAALVQPEIKLSDRRLYLLPSLWISTHDADQLDSEARGLEKAKWWHDGAAAVHALVQRDILQQEAVVSADTARLISGANAALMFYHDNPLIQQRLLDSIERPNSRKPYEEFRAEDGTLMRRYMSPAELIANFEDKNRPKVNLLAVTDWQVIGMNYLKKRGVDGFVTPDSPFGLDPMFERSFNTQLQTLANLPDGAQYDDEGHVIVRADQGEDRALVPNRLLTDRLRIDIAFLGDLLRTVDIFDMPTPGLGIVRKAHVPMNRHVPFYREGALEEIRTRESKLPTPRDSYWRRSGYESSDLILQIQRRPEQLRPALEEISWVRDYAYALHTRNINSLVQTLPILMSGDRNAVEKEIRGILMDEFRAMEAKIQRSRRLTTAEKDVEIAERLAQVEHEVSYTMTCLEEQIVPYDPTASEAVRTEGTILLEEAGIMYARRYGGRRKVSPQRPSSTHHSTSKSSSRMRTVRAHAIQFAA